MLIGFMAVPIPADGGVFAGDVGLNGPDGEGGNFLLLPPGYKDAVPKGYYVYRSGMNSVMVTLRAFVPDPSKMAELTSPALTGEACWHQRASALKPTFEGTQSRNFL